MLEGPPQGMGTGGNVRDVRGWGIGGVFDQLYIHFLFSSHVLIFLCHFIVFTVEQKCTSSVANVSITKLAGAM